MPKEQPYYTLLVENGEDFKVYYCLDRFNKRLRVDDYEGMRAPSAHECWKSPRPTP
ncbi:hypothetical protein LJK88_41670 [Paenibacillus sp. P26]|nr:hypothetical protein LJK88_41670 [Paenibacillus sp. P26]